MLRGLGSLNLNPLQHSPVQYNIIHVVEYILYKTVTVYRKLDPVLSVLLQSSPVFQLQWTDTSNGNTNFYKFNYNYKHPAISN